jgi:hypothetical protein
MVPHDVKLGTSNSFYDTPNLHLPAKPDQYSGLYTVSSISSQWCVCNILMLLVFAIRKGIIVVGCFDIDRAKVLRNAIGRNSWRVRCG